MKTVCLLIEDDQAFADSVIASLTEEDIGVDHALTWEEGVDLFRVAAHPLVVADYNLEGSELGLKLLARLRSLHPGTRLLLISGWLDEDNREAIEKLGLVDGFHPKTTELANILLQEGREAVERAQLRTDWTGLAQAHIKRAEMSDDDIDTLDQVLRTRLPDGK